MGTSLYIRYVAQAGGESFQVSCVDGLSIPLTQHEQYSGSSPEFWTWGKSASPGSSVR